ncbi:TPA: capsular biosynthesis protein [Vibrio parahaemolyticus]
MFLIMSGAYVGVELEAEFGKIPPSFLPLGNKRLFRHQIALAPKGTEVFISIPYSYDISQIDNQWLEEQNVKILRVPETLSLGASLVAALNMSGDDLNEPLHVLYGDSLYKSLPVGEDIVGVSIARSGYNWATLLDESTSERESCPLNEETVKDKVIDGFFKFSNPRRIIQNITQNEWDFIAGLRHYHRDIGLTLTDSDTWLDFGHVNTYYASKAEFTTQRAFNELKINSRWIEKSSCKDSKIAAEANWFEKIPYDLKAHTPQYLGSENKGSKISYKLEYLYLTALNELFVFSKISTDIWTKILSNCIDFLSLCALQEYDYTSPVNSLDKLFYQKTIERLNNYCLDNKFSLEQSWIYNDSISVSLSELLETSRRYLPSESDNYSVLHGDFCFSNILYDFRSDKIKTIDPRGISPEGTQTIYGDIYYDLAKLSHSILGLYDWIIAGYFDVEISENKIDFIIHDNDIHLKTQNNFIEMVSDKFGLSEKNLYAMQIELFLSMLPLHSDDPKRQKGLFANAFRLYKKLVRL